MFLNTQLLRSPTVHGVGGGAVVVFVDAMFLELPSSGVNVARWHFGPARGDIDCMRNFSAALHFHHAVEAIHLEGCELRSVIELIVVVGLTSFQNLRYLSLKYSRLSHQALRELARLRHERLEALDLSYCWLSAADVQWLPRLAQLHKLAMHHNVLDLCGIDTLFRALPTLYPAIQELRLNDQHHFRPPGNASQSSNLDACSHLPRTNAVELPQLAALKVEHVFSTAEDRCAFFRKWIDFLPALTQVGEEPLQQPLASHRSRDRASIPARGWFDSWPRRRNASAEERVTMEATFCDLKETAILQHSEHERGSGRRALK